MAKLVTAAAAVGGKPYLVTLLCLDAGLRLGEATGSGAGGVAGYGLLNPRG